VAHRVERPWPAADHHRQQWQVSYASNQPKPLWSTIWFEAALAALDGGTPAGPYLLAALDYENAKLHASKKKINGADARCLAFDDHQHRPTTLCIDPASGHMLTADSDLGSFEYSDYTMLGSNSYPQTVMVDYMGKPMEQAQVTVTRDEQFPDSLFAAPANSATASFASCADSATNFTPPHLDKSVKAKRPEGYTYGIVWVLAAVGKDGSVEKAEVLGGPHALRTAATSAVKRYKYTPYVRCGQNVAFQQTVMVPFPPPPPQRSFPVDQRIPQPSYPTCFPCAPQ
jgi:hypothetical protein